MNINPGLIIVLENAKKNPEYRPYCMRCSGLVRMNKIKDFYWRCDCGAICDLREKDELNNQ